MLSTSGELSELEQANAQVVAVGESFELPPLAVGLDGANAVLEFLKTSEGQDLRVIAIYGLAGVGKTTLLNYVWDAFSTKVPFHFARAYVQTGPDATDSTIRWCQSIILKQLGGGSKEFPHTGSGRAELNNHFRLLKTQGKPLFLAIDNVLDVSDLQRLLPDKLRSGNLPTSSCIVLTCRNFGIVRALVRDICDLNLSDADRVLCFEPRPFDLQESRRMFAECADMQDSASEHQELLDALVPLCGGLPLALTVLGMSFRDEQRRGRVEWQHIPKLWSFQDDDDDDEITISIVMKALQHSFDRLHESRQIAFLDMVSTFYGWPWERVERIVNKNIMRDLKNSSLVWKVDNLSKCNGSALRWGYGWRCYKNLRRGGCVSMHGLTLRFGERILYENNIGYREYVRPPPGHHLSTLRTLIMSENSDALELIQHATGLKMLALLHDGQTSNYIRYHLECRLDEDFFQASSCDEWSRYANQLRHLMVHGCKWSRILEMKVSRELRELILKGCGNLVQLPDTPLCNLEVLEISDCPEFRGFSASCVEEWHLLQDLYLRNCPYITVIPEDFGSLPSLRGICIKECTNLGKFPSLRSLQGPSSLTISRCPRLHTLGDMFCPLESLEMIHLPALTKLPAGIFNASSLQMLFIMACDGLMELVPEEESTNMASLLKLAVVECRGLGRLSAGIFRTAANSLIVLDLEGCENLVELPKEIGGLCSLEELRLRKCKKLEKLPDSIASVSSLKKLHLGHCESLMELPQQIGGLCSLRELNLCECRKLEKLPDSISSITSLEALHLDDCESLTELPEQIGSLHSLRQLNLGGCELEELPDSLASITSLEILNLGGCREFPRQVGGLCSLKQLTLFSCPELEKLPNFLISVRSLEVLSVFECESLTELPQEIGGLCCLKQLWLDGCIKLEKLPDSVTSITSLEQLFLVSCESLMELPQEMGGLCSLKELWLHRCNKLVKLPDSITNITSLEILELRECESLMELPQQIQGLCSLKRLWLNGCKKLEKLPKSITSIISLDMLIVENCGSLVVTEEIKAFLELKENCRGRTW